MNNSYFQSQENVVAIASSDRQYLVHSHILLLPSSQHKDMHGARSLGVAEELGLSQYLELKAQTLNTQQLLVGTLQ
jgi:hypothetical protein